jgi:hypothetical protein
MRPARTANPVLPGQKKGQDDAKAAFSFWKDVRNKLIVHNESGYSTLVTGVVLGKDAVVHDILSTLVTADMTGDQAACKNLYELIVAAQKHVAKDIDAILPRVFEEVKLMTAEARAALPDVIYVVPSREKLAQTRPPRAK